MAYEVRIKKPALKNLRKAPVRVQEKFTFLLEDLTQHGPVQPNWPNYSKLAEDKYHCHLTYHWVACWTWEEGSIEMEVYYVGTREKAPY